jgi:hypothetical protein
MLRQIYSEKDIIPKIIVFNACISNFVMAVEGNKLHNEGISVFGQ